jgi:DNA-binding MarR family transcriptional regulator
MITTPKISVPDVAKDLPRCACFNLRRAARAVTQAYDEALRPSGIRATQFSLLAALALEGPATITRLADAMGMDRTTLTRNLKPLLKDGLVEMAEGSDRRRRRVGLTGRGMETLEQALPLWRAAQARVIDGLGTARWTGMLRDLERAIHVVHSG